MPMASSAQIVPSGAHAPGVISTANGLPQVNVNKPSAGGVSLNTYSQFDVQQPGAILNNSPTIVNTQLAGAVVGLRGQVQASLGALDYDLFVGTPVYKPASFPASTVVVGFQIAAQF